MKGIFFVSSLAMVAGGLMPTSIYSKAVSLIGLVVWGTTGVILLLRSLKEIKADTAEILSEAERLESEGK